MTKKQLDIIEDVVPQNIVYVSGKPVQRIPGEPRKN